MKEDGATKSGDWRRIIIAQYDQQIIAFILPPKLLMAAGIGATHQLIIGGICWIIAPAKISAKRMDWQFCHRR